MICLGASAQTPRPGSEKLLETKPQFVTGLRFVTVICKSHQPHSALPAVDSGLEYNTANHLMAQWLAILFQIVWCY
ncbi:MAG: hypothetical protein UT52_C0032G0004 [Candidatus Uhrbacteria bacterium GW2011_GWE1_39_46]|nr:MAG: hypothetical protein UT52_C0032G0004 [Candidatus Uhrbacteria bacterium GW2011_GWE1_39_46]